MDLWIFPDYGWVNTGANLQVSKDYTITSFPKMEAIWICDEYGC